MKIVQAPRASAILYHLLAGQREKRAWLLPANICPIVPITFLKAGVPFEWVDISVETLHMDLDQAETLIRRRRFGGLLYAHTYGEPSTPNHFFAAIKDLAPELVVIDDRCLCIPALEADFNNQADVQLYSTGYAKIAELNFGGYAFMREHLEYGPQHVPFDPHHLEAMELSYKDAIKQNKPYEYQDNNWLDTETAVPAWHVYREHIESALAEALEHRRQMNETYASLLPMAIQLPASYQSWRFNIRLQNRDAVLSAIFSRNVFASAHYASLAGIMGTGSAPRAEALANEILNLFNDRHFSPAQAEQTCKIILENLS
jgi:dTDP-4-amino-4,6-dideoxygalactose transaminase